MSYSCKSFTTTQKRKRFGVSCAYDEHRTKVLNAYGIDVVRYTNEEILNHFEDVESNLRKKINERSRELKDGKNIHYVLGDLKKK